MKPAGQPNHKVNNEIASQEELIDTYELFAGIFKESGGHCSYTPKLDNTLPLIYGKPAMVRQLFCQFLSNYLATPNEVEGKSVLISHTKNRQYWIFNLQTLSNTTEASQIQSLHIHKGAIQNAYSNSNSPFQPQVS